MSYYSYRSYRPYVTVAERQRQARAQVAKSAKKGVPLSPIHIQGTKIATTFWGSSWCRNLEAYSDFSNRLPRGRSYVRNGSVIDLRISNGLVEAKVQGSSLYEVNIKFTPLPPTKWKEFKSRSAGKVINLLDLLQGRLSKELLGDITSQETGLFPAPKEIKLSCSCPDWADMCKHVAATLYGVGARLDEKPELFFTLRGVDMQELLSAATAATVVGSPEAGSAAVLDGADLSQIFGVELESNPAADTETAKKKPDRRKPKPARPAAKAAATKKSPRTVTPKKRRPKR